MLFYIYDNHAVIEATPHLRVLLTVGIVHNIRIDIIK